MIELDKVAVSYGERTLFSDVSLTLDQGSFHFLTGPSGSGKTTLIRLCSMEMQPTSGHVKIFGSSTEGLGRDGVSALRSRVGVVHQDSRFIDHLSVSENVMLPASVTGTVTAHTPYQLVELLGWVGLTAQTDNLPPELSGGERQRVALARAVIQSPDVLLADEPTGNVDWEMSQRLLDLLIELNQLGKTVLCATHDLHLVRYAKSKVAAKVLRLKGGRVEVAGAEL